MTRPECRVPIPIEQCMTSRVVLVCQRRALPMPPAQHLAGHSALKASRSAIVGAAQLLENRHVVKRTRVAGNRNDLISFDADGFENRGFDATAYLQMTTLFKEGFSYVNNTALERQLHLQELVDFAQFLAERMPILQKDWLEHRDSRRENIAK